MTPGTARQQTPAEAEAAHEARLAAHAARVFRELEGIVKQADGRPRKEKKPLPTPVALKPAKLTRKRGPHANSNAARIRANPEIVVRPLLGGEVMRDLATASP